MNHKVVKREGSTSGINFGAAAGDRARNDGLNSQENSLRLDFEGNFLVIMKHWKDISLGGHDIPILRQN